MTDREKLELIIKSLDAKRGEDIQAIKIGDLTICNCKRYQQYTHTYSCRRGGIPAFTEGH